MRCHFGWLYSACHVLYLCDAFGVFVLKCSHFSTGFRNVCSIRRVFHLKHNQQNAGTLNVHRDCSCCGWNWYRMNYDKTVCKGVFTTHSHINRYKLRCERDTFWHVSTKFAIRFTPFRFSVDFVKCNAKLGWYEERRIKKPSHTHDFWSLICDRLLFGVVVVLCRCPSDINSNKKKKKKSKCTLHIHPIIIERECFCSYKCLRAQI